eukprot:4113662-Amphidinium_carterae.1
MPELHIARPPALSPKQPANNQRPTSCSSSCASLESRFDSLRIRVLRADTLAKAVGRQDFLTTVSANGLVLVINKNTPSDALAKKLERSPTSALL